MVITSLVLTLWALRLGALGPQIIHGAASRALNHELCELSFSELAIASPTSYFAHMQVSFLLGNYVRLAPLCTQWRGLSDLQVISA
jgi:hypothetical protein